MAYLQQNRSFIFDNFYAEARSRETYTSKLNYEKTKQKKNQKNSNNKFLFIIFI